MLQIMKRFGWTWIGLLFIGGESISRVAHSFQSELVQSGLGCLAYMEAMPYDIWSDPAELQRIVTVMKKSTAQVVIAFSPGYQMFQLMEEVGVMIYFFHLSLFI